MAHGRQAPRDRSHSRNRLHARGDLRRPARGLLLAALALLCWPQRPSLFCGQVSIERLVPAAQGKLAMHAEEGKSSEAAGGGKASATSEAPSAGAAEENPIVSVWAKVKAELGEDMQKARDARLGFFLKDQFVLQNSEQKANEMPLYKRKYQTLGTNLVTQEASAKAFGRVVRKARDSENVKEMIGLVRSRLYMDEVDEIQIGDELATFFFKEVLPEARVNPVLDAVAGTISTFITLGVLLAIVICCLGSTPVELDD
mmetsp:Transcript_62873/g.116895  ORF Transcript_62873/g.116895 Transcript_62873/m.116895 type:complete len:257 (-) Transcript_62873:49-819(-)